MISLQIILSEMKEEPQDCNIYFCYLKIKIYIVSNREFVVFLMNNKF